MDGHDALESDKVRPIEGEDVGDAVDKHRRRVAPVPVRFPNHTEGAPEPVLSEVESLP
jgi:hypothetical protein